MAIRPPKYNSQGYTLLEMLAVLGMAGIILGLAVPSLLSLNKPLRDGANQFKNHLSLVRSKAISSNQAYRLRPKYLTRAEYPGGIPRNFVVEYAANCKVAENNVAPVTTRWQMASQFDLDLPPLVGITDIASSTFAGPVIGTISNGLTWNICFDNRGIVDTTRQIILKDFQGNNQARIALFDIGKVGNVEILTYTNSMTNNYATNTQLTDGQNPANPSF